MSVVHRTRIVRGLKTGWLESGPHDRPILLLLHGYPDGPGVWDRQQAHFGEDFQIVCPEMRGIGNSEPAKTLARMGTQALAFDVLEILKQVDPDSERPILCVGHDLGAALAWSLAPLLGDRLRGLVIVNGLSTTQMLHRLIRPAQLRKSWYMFFMQTPIAPEALTALFPTLVPRLAYALGELDAEDRPVHEGRESRYPLNQYRGFLRELPKLLLQETPKLSCPLLVLWGARDAFVLPPSLDELEPYARKIEIRILDGNHWIFRTHADKVNALIGNFAGRVFSRVFESS